MCPDPTSLSAYFDNEVSSDESLRIREHLAECPACRATLEVFSRRREAIVTDGPQKLDEGDRLEQFWTFVGQNRIQKVSSPRRLSLPIPVAAAAAAVFIAAVAMNFFNLGGRRVPDIVVVETPRPVPTVVSLTVTPGELEDFFALLEAQHPVEDDGLVVLPAELPVALLGEPQMVRPASLEGGN